MGFPGSLVVKNLPASAGDAWDTGSIPGSGRSPGGGHSNTLQYPCLKNPMDRGAWQIIVHRIAKSRTRLSNWTEWSVILRIFSVLVDHLYISFGKMSLQILCPFLLIHSSFHKHIVRSYNAPECTKNWIYNGKQNCVPTLREGHSLVVEGWREE